MGKPVAGEVASASPVGLFRPQTDLAVGKRRPALVLDDLPSDDLILCQITTRHRSDNFSVSLDNSDFERGQLQGIRQ